MRYVGTRRIGAASVMRGLAVALAFAIVTSCASGGLSRGDVARRLQTVARDPTLSAPPPGATLWEANGIECPDDEPPLYFWSWSYSRAGVPEGLPSYYDERLKQDGWKRIADTAQGAQYVKSYGRWDARAKVGVSHVIVYVTETWPSWCDETT